MLSNPEAELLEPGGEVFFALLGEEVVGTCALRVEAPGRYELTKMAVDAARRGLGVGRKLIEAAIARFHQLGGRELFLESNQKLAPALRLYESAGFVHAPRPSPSHYQRSDVYMGLRAEATGEARRQDPVQTQAAAVTQEARAVRPAPLPARVPRWVSAP